MNTKNLVVAVLLASAASLSFASIAPNADGTPGKTRAEVQAEYQQARDNGWHMRKESDSFTISKSTRTRAEVKAEMLQARADRAASGHHISPEE